jgi:hypothetical protein
MNTPNETRGFALLIKAPHAVRSFEPRQGDTIKILDESGKEVWSLKIPVPVGNPGVILHEVQIDLLTERAFGEFCKNSWTKHPEEILSEIRKGDKNG